MMLSEHAGESVVGMLWRLEGNFSSLACHAAIEIDAILARRATPLEAVRFLAEVLDKRLVSVSEPTSPDSLIDPATVVLVDQALADSHLAPPSRTVTELVEQAGDVARLLRDFAESPGDFHRPESQKQLEQMRAFCLALSERALGRESEMEESDTEVFLGR